ncbi:MAG TPA: methyltransferase domain-containing protein [Vicinamibacterales bacterium]|jgi:ubiquinone/menaquinone biosynthesis C-methylase UbiE|nr:methyltransferase domain-containing protein [Vicinamibacterales bacterium]
MATIVADRSRRIEALGYDYASQPRQEITACNLCGQSRFVVLTHRDRYGYPAEAHACMHCGLVFLNPRMTAAAYGRFYDGVYRPLVSAFHGRLIDATTIQSEQRDYAAERAAFIRPFVEQARPRTLLDIGGSTGVVAHWFAQTFGLEGVLIDPAPLEVHEARRLGLETITGLVEEHDFGARRFDLVIVCQTVDHLLDVGGVLARVRRLLTDAGLLFIDIVDFRAAYLRHWSVEEAVKIDHPYYLVQETMTAYLARNGFDVLRADYAADHLHVSYVCRRSGRNADALPPAATADALLREIRYVQNAPRP